MWKLLRPISIIIGVFVLLVLIGLVIHEIIEARGFRELSRQPGVQISIGSRHGNLLSGYDLKDIEIRQTAGRGDTPPGIFRTALLSVHWELRPFSLTSISWDEGSFSFATEDGTEERITIGAGSLSPDDTGWLVGDRIKIGPDRWDGSALLKIRADGKELEGSMNIDHLPSRYIEIAGTAPEDFRLPAEVIVSIEFSGAPGNIRGSGSVSNSLTRQTYRF